MSMKRISKLNFVVQTDVSICFMVEKHKEAYVLTVLHRVEKDKE